MVPASEPLGKRERNGVLLAKPVRNACIQLCELSRVGGSEVMTARVVRQRREKWLVHILPQAHNEVRHTAGPGGRERLFAIYAAHGSEVLAIREQDDSPPRLES